jgi:hypothetical protein
MFTGETVAVTTDAWTSADNTAYTCYHFSWIDDQWRLQAMGLGISAFSGKHSGERILEDAVKNLEKAGINMPQVRRPAMCILMVLNALYHFTLPPISRFLPENRCRPSSPTQQPTW